MQFRGVAYQVVAHIRHADVYREHISDVIGFIVDLQWAKAVKLAGTVERGVAGWSRDRSRSDADRHRRGWPARRRQPAVAHCAPDRRRQFPLLFFDPDTAVAGKVGREEWTVAVSANNDPSLTRAVRVANQMMAVGVTASIALVVALILMARAQGSHAARQSSRGLRVGGHA